MCHSLSWKEWEVLADEERREDEEPRVFGDEAQPEAVEVEAEPKRTPERERVLIRA